MILGVTSQKKCKLNYYEDEEIKKNFNFISLNLKSFKKEKLDFFFINIKRLVLESFNQSYSDLIDSYKFCNSIPCLQRGLINCFKMVEYVRITCFFLIDKKINLPNVRIMELYCQTKKIIKLNTPLLQFLHIQNLDYFRFPYPESLKYLQTFEIGKTNPKNFKNLEIFVLNYFYIEKINILKIYLKYLPSLKFLFLGHSDQNIGYQMLNEQKTKKLEISIIDVEFDYKNWNKYTKYRNKLNHWPVKFDILYSQLIENNLPLKYFKENYLQIGCLIVDYVGNKSQLIDFIKCGDDLISSLEIQNNTNLDQDFFDNLPKYLPFSSLTIYLPLNLIDYSFLEKIQIFKIELCFEIKLNRQIFLNLFNNEFCQSFWFKMNNDFSDFNHLSEKEKEGCFHWIERDEDCSFFCNTCPPVDWKFLKFKSIEEVVNHVENFLEKYWLNENQ